MVIQLKSMYFTIIVVVCARDEVWLTREEELTCCYSCRTAAAVAVALGIGRNDTKGHRILCTSRGY